MTAFDCFKAYDIRGRVGANLTEDIARRIGAGFAVEMKAARVVVGRDARASSAALGGALIDGLTGAGADVLDLGFCGTEEVYFATTHLGADGGIEITGSHNPIEYNGMKLVGRGSVPVGPDTGLGAIRARCEAGPAQPGAAKGRVTDASAARADYVGKVVSFADISALRPLRILFNTGNGMAGPTLDAIMAELARQGAPIEPVYLFKDPDGTFPNGIPNPLLPEMQPATSRAVTAAGADFGVAFDGDFDRCFFFDHTGTFIPGEYVVGLLAQAFLARSPGEAIVHDPRVVWNVADAVAAAGGRAVQTRTGHTFVKQAMRDTGAIYGGEMSAHHYFRDFMYCDSGMIPWLLVAELVSRTGRSLADLVGDRMRRFPSSGEVNFRIADPGAAIAEVVAAYAPDARSRDDTDGTSLAFDDWRFNLRMSNTEPLVRVNVESRGDPGLVARRLAELSARLAARETRPA
ncbi:MAG: phosphomannomutase [Pseudomonadota bacterium]